MTAAQHNIVIEQGTTFERTITWRDSAETLIDLTGYRIRMQVRAEADSATTYVDFDSEALGAGMTIGSLDATGVIAIALAPAATSPLVFTNAVYDLLAISGGGVTYRLLEGRATVIPAVTR